jgi:hypothetical protein
MREAAQADSAVIFTTRDPELATRFGEDILSLSGSIVDGNRTPTTT